jgi:hypothetical protein
MLRASIVIGALSLVGGSAFADDKSCVANEDCSTLEFCSTEASAGCNDAGVCASRGVNVMCMNVSDPVCGCDGKTYDNPCIAHKAGVSVAYVGSCCEQSQ